MAFTRFVDLFASAFDKTKELMSEIEAGHVRAADAQDLAFHAVSAAMRNLEFAIEQEGLSVSWSGHRINNTATRYSGLVQTLHERLEGKTWDECVYWVDQDDPEPED